MTDTGSGISPDHLGRIFEPFFTTKTYGTGLGLTNVKRLVEDNGGTLAVTSNQGKGTSFTLRFRAAH
ncbi:MAG: ATP-binding protein [Nitrospira sp.]